MNEFEAVLAEVLRRVTPSPEERERVGAVVENVVEGLRKAVAELALRAEVEVEGSYAKDTWLSGDVDVDVFLLFDTGVSLEELRAGGLAAARMAAQLVGARCVERFASHPYLTLLLDACSIDVVPAYRVPSPLQIRSPVDRTPFHTSYVKRRLDEKPELRKDVRILKRFAKGTGVYGAEVKVEGFSGYLLELLVIHYGSFPDFIRSAARWKPYKVIIDIEGHYPNKRSILERFKDPLVVIDPVDPDRNVASPVSLESLSRFIAAARAFLRKPSIHFFYPVTPEPRQLEALLEGRAVAAVKLRVPTLPEDILWGQVKRALRALQSGLERFGFPVIGASAWAEGGEVVLLFELETLELPPLERHEGPPVYSDHDERFISAYAAGRCVAGPYIEGDRWVVIRPRKVRNAREALTKLLSTYNIGEHLTECAKSGFQILTGGEVVKASTLDSYRAHLYGWLTRKEPWMLEAD
ncbi:MAG: CCA tRNA nucleotidyltransferase [Thermofilaceae archaeon]